jgi:hypothetical protein
MTEDEKREIAEFRALCKEAALKIDPETAEIASWFTRVVDPYDILEDVREGGE